MAFSAKRYAIQGIHKEMKLKIYSEIEKDSQIFEFADKSFNAICMFHRTEHAMINFLCQQEKDRKYYEVLFLHFKSDEALVNMKRFLSDLKNQFIPNLNRPLEFTIGESAVGKNITILERYTKSISLKKMIDIAYLFGAIKEQFTTPEFGYRIIVKVWSAVRGLRETGLRSMSFSSLLIYLFPEEEVTEQDDLEIFLNQPGVYLDYKLANFKKLMVAEGAEETSLDICVKMNIINKLLFENMERVEDMVSDHLNFVIILLEIATVSSADNFIKEIDFKNGNLASSLRQKVRDPFILDLIEDCLKDRFKEESSFFNRSYKSLSFLESMANGEFENVEYDNVEESIFVAGLKCIPIGKSLTFLISIEGSEFSVEKEFIIAQSIINRKLISSTVFILSDFGTGLFLSLNIIKVVTYYTTLLLDGNSSQSYSLDSPSFRQFILIALRVYSLHSDLVRYLIG